MSFNAASGVPSLTKENVYEVGIKVPSLTEQRKIATYFKSLDRLIAARRDEIEQLKHMKAALLNRMFV